ncbi:methyl-accepting chemotaxis protein [Haloferax mucosum ATCC BAA-1512]|uniref:Methyl-accepting chemotaxis protein n=1 Tax=Haloferax mucosum ATCC BAA-1512 TaxID=662479 RepID=M0IJC8_9EURY|nr:methyl-accepting chemotaxis protein [Haloferax mucosum]ELZ96911.1 methyl-accepting chemotaxis protein [Haloferax mucosum ATCC BAA-1512]
MGERWSRFRDSIFDVSLRGLTDRISQRAGSAVPQSLRRTYARKFFAATLVAMLLMAGIGAVTYTSVHSSLDSQVEQQLTSTAALQADGIESWIDSKRMETRSTSSAWQFQLGNSQAASSYLFQRSAELGQEDLTAIHYVSLATGEIDQSTASSLEGETAAEAGLPWSDIEQHVNPEPNQVYVSSETFQSPVTDEPSFVLASKPPENAESVVLVTVSLPARITETEQTMAGSQTTLYGTDGTAIISTSANESVPGHDTNALTNGTAFDQTDERVVAYTPVEGVDWTLSTAVPTATAYSVRDSVGGGLLVTILAALGSLGVVAAVLGRRTTRTLGELTDRATEMADGDLGVDLETDRIDEFGTLYASFDEMRESLKESLETAEALNDHLEAQAEEYRAVMERCADGDLTCRMNPDSESDAMADIARTYNRTMDELATVIADAQTFSEAVAESSDATSASVGDANEASHAVSESMTDILDDVVEQDEHLDDVTERMSDFSAAIQQVNASASDVAANAEAATNRGERGRDAAENAISELRAIEVATKNTVEQVRELESAIADIESVVDFIDEIASQTHILALNASIEAAHAGEFGDGFAVVADEVQQLAEETQDATGQISASIERVRDRTEATAADIRQTRTRVGEGSETIEEAMAAIDTIVDDVEDTADGIQEIRRATEQQAGATTEVVSMVEDVSEISDRTSVGARDAVTATEAQTDALAEVSDRVERLADRASDLQVALDRFDVAAEGDSTRSSERESRAATEKRDTPLAERVGTKS